MPDNVTEERPPDDAELLQHLVGDEMQKTKKQQRRARTDLDIFWDDCSKEIKRETNPDNKAANLYYLPAYSEYLREYKPPTLTIWTCLTLGNLKRFNKKYNVGLPKQQGRNILIQNLTSAQVESYFKNIKKNQGLRNPLHMFIEDNLKDLKWQQRQFFDGILDAQKKSVDNSLDSNLAKTSLLESNKDSINDQRDANSTYRKEHIQIEEGWNKIAKNIGKSNLGYYRSVRNRPLKFPSNDDAENGEVVSNSEETCSFCNTANQTSNEDEYINWVMCNVCQQWFHCHCLRIDVSLSKYSVCPRCVDNFFTGFCRYLSYHVTENLKITNRNDVRRLYDVWSRKGTDTRLCIINQPIKEKRKICIERHILATRRIQNVFSNFWFNVILQTVCGAWFYEILPQNFYDDDPVFIWLKSINKN